jgi:hypothetical protein
LYIDLCLVRDPTKRESLVTNKLHKFISLASAWPSEALGASKRRTKERL